MENSTVKARINKLKTLYDESSIFAKESCHMPSAPLDELTEYIIDGAAYPMAPYWMKRLNGVYKRLMQEKKHGTTWIIIRLQKVVDMFHQLPEDVRRELREWNTPFYTKKGKKCGCISVANMVRYWEETYIPSQLHPRSQVSFAMLAGNAVYKKLKELERG